MKTLVLKKQQDRRLQAGHLWIYSNEVDTVKSSLKSFFPGELATVVTAAGKSIGMAYVNPHTLLCARLLSRKTNQTINADFFRQCFQTAQQKRIQIFSEPFYRCIYGESDGLPGLIIDKYDQIIVAQFNTAGIENFRNELLTTMVDFFKPQAILLANDSRQRVVENLASGVEWVYGTAVEEVLISENNCQYWIPMANLQKTGWFYDQRLNRQRLAAYVQNKTVLDVFSYVGSFAIQAAIHGAKKVVAIEQSHLAASYIARNAQLHQYSELSVLQEDAFVALERLLSQHQTFDVIILDPPAFIQQRKDFEKGFKAYFSLHQLAMKLLNPGGILCTTSCSMHLSSDDLQNILRQIAIKSRRSLSILEHCHQGPDHPIHPAIPETEYLKGFIAAVD